MALHRPDNPSYHLGGRMPAPTGAGAIHRSPSAAYSSLSHAYEQPSPQFPHPALALLPPSPPPPPPPWKPSPYVTVSSALSSPGMLMRQQREWARRQWRMTGPSIMSAGRSPPAPPAAPPLRALPPPITAAAGADDDGGAVAAGAGAVAPDSLFPFSPRSFHRNNAFTASFTTLYHDTTLEGVAIHAARARRHAEAQRRKLERRREELLQMQALVIKYRNRAEYLRSRIRADRERRYACFLAVVHRMQAVFRRRQLLKRRDEERRRAEEAATRALQDWGRRLVGVLRAKQELDHRRHAARCRAAAPVIGRALKRWWAMRLAQRDKEKEAARRRQLLNRMRAARLTIALWCQRHYRGAKARARVAAWRNERRRKMRARAMLARWPAVDDKRKPFR